MDGFEYVKTLCEGAKRAQIGYSGASGETRNRLLVKIAGEIEADSAEILDANAVDLQNAESNGVPKTMLDRLMLNEKRVADIAEALRDVSKLPDPCGCGERITRPNGLVITKTRVPLGVVAVIYESRPNVTPDAAAICLKAGNAVVLRGGKEAICSNRAISRSIRRAISMSGFDENLVSFVDDPTRESSAALMKMRGLIDVLLPRGGRGLIKSVVENASVPVIETGAGNCHLFIDESADPEMALRIAVNAKCSRPSVCNAIETLLLHKAVAEDFLPKFYEATRKYGLELRGDCAVRAIIPEAKQATDEDYDTEFNDFILAVKVVSDVGEAIEHIRRYSTGHSEAIVTENLANARKFEAMVDAAAVYVNASTRFTDGGEFGFGAELGISTQKLHVRGPMGPQAVTTIKYLVEGDGQIR